MVSAYIDSMKCVHPIFSLLLCFHALFSINSCYVTARQVTNERSELVSAIFIFGDSTSDPGNNNFIPTPFRSNFAPYGRDFANQVPTGRFTNGRLVADFIAEYIGVKDLVPPYLDPSLSIDELKTGVSFASAASGFDPLTPKISNVISLSKQLEYFKEYQSRLKAAIGKEKTEQLVKNGLYVISAGTNDFVVNYFTLPIRRKTYDLPSYMEFLLQHIRHFMQGLQDLGARRIGFAGLASMGCLPVVITLNSQHAITQRGCINSYSSTASNFNVLLQKELHAMQSKFSHLGSRIAYLDTYKVLEDMVHGHNYKFEEVNSGCCGTGLLETSFLCNPKSAVCPDASQYIFFDSIHPTEIAYNITFHAVRPVIDSLIKPKI